MDSRGDGLAQFVDDVEGVFVVATEEGVAYLLDLDERPIATLPERTTSGPEPESVRVLTLVTCTVGEPMVARVDRGVPGVWFTRRVKAPVTRIEIEPADLRTGPPRRARPVSTGRGDDAETTHRVADGAGSARFVPVKAAAYWELLEPVVVSAARVTEREARGMYPVATAFVLWAWQTKALELDVKTMFRRSLVEEFVHRGMGSYTRGSRATCRSLLLAIVDAVAPPSEASFPIPRSAPTPPYPPAEVATLRSWASAQGTAARRRDACLVLPRARGCAPWTYARSWRWAWTRCAATALSLSRRTPATGCS